MNKQLLLFVFILVSCTSLAQSKKKSLSIDSVSYYLDLQNYQKAIDLLDQQIAIEPSADRFISRGLAKIEISELDNALADFESSLDLLSENDTAYYNIGYINYLKGQYDKAIQYYDSALLINNESIFYLIARGDAFLELDNYTLALKDYRDVINIDNQADLGYYGIAMCHYFSERYDSARYYLSYAINIDPFDPDYYYQRALCKYILDDEEKLLNDLNLAIDIEADFADARSLRAQLFIEDDRYTEALEDLNIAVASDSSDLDILSERGALLLEVGDYEGALKDFTTLIETVTDSDMAYFNYGLSLYLLEYPEKAEKAFEKAISLNGRDESYFTYRALAKAGQDDFSGAIDDFQHAIDLNAENPDAYFNRAKVLFQFEEYDAALDDLILTFSLDPEYEGLHLMLGEVYSILGEVDLAMKYYDLSIMFDPKNAENLFKRGVFLYEIENIDGAMDDFNQAIKLDESVPAPYTNRGLLRFELKDKSGACEDWKKAFQLGSEYAQELLKKNCR